MILAETIERSLELVVERAGDPGNLVYEHVFNRWPHLRALFVLDTSGAVRAEMLYRAIEAVRDLVGEGLYARGLIATEWSNHQGMGVPPDQFDGLFVAMIQAFREILGPDWGTHEQSAWNEVLARVRAIISGLASN